MRARDLLIAALSCGAPLAGQGAPADSTARADTIPLSLMREVFTFQGGGRDPFVQIPVRHGSPHFSSVVICEQPVW